MSPMTIRIDGYRLGGLRYSDIADWQEGVAVRLQDGQMVALRPGEKIRIPSVHGSQPFAFELDFLAEDTPLARVSLSIFATTLETYSNDYNLLISRAVRDAFLNQVFSLHNTITLADLEKWPDTTYPSYWPFLKFYLYQLSEVLTRNFVDEEVRAFLENPEGFEEDGRGAYFTLLTNDPDRGALTEQELKSVQQALNQAYLAHEITFFEYTFTWLLVATGIRPIQMAWMTFKDVLIDDGPAGKGREVNLRIPIAKGTRATKPVYIMRRAPSVLADVLIRFIGSKKQVNPDEPLFFGVARDVNVCLSKIFKKMRTYSERTNGPIHITPYRFRYTLGTRAIAQGATDAQVARLLTHTTTNSIKHYRAAMAMHQSAIQDAIGEDMDFFAGVFNGRIINDFDEATHSHDYNKLIRDFERLTGKVIGACGSSVECHQDAPRACLTCWMFEPFLEGPWNLLKVEIQRDIDHETEARIKQIGIDQLNGLRRIQAACDAKRRILEEGSK